MPEIIQPLPRVDKVLVATERRRFTLRIGQCYLLFYKGGLIAIKDGLYIYRPEANQGKAAEGLINKFVVTGEPLMRLANDDFDFTVASAITRNILPLTRRS